MAGLYEADVRITVAICYNFLEGAQAKDLGDELLQDLFYWKADYMGQFEYPDQFGSEFNVATLGLFRKMRKRLV